jgi:hypothetical protein
VADIHILSGLTVDEHLWLTAILEDDWAKAHAIAVRINGDIDFDFVDHLVEVVESMQAMAGPATWSRLNEKTRVGELTLPLWTEVVRNLSFDLGPSINLRMLRAFLKSEAWRQYIYDEAYDEEEGAVVTD